LQINKIFIHNFGKFEKKEIEFDKGLNVVYGCNEAGKSTVQAFIKGMLYDLDKTEEKQYLPWGKDEFGAVNRMIYTMDNGQRYVVEKNFNRKSTSIFRTEPYEEITALFPMKKGNLLYAEQQLGLNWTAFQSSVFIEQSEVRIPSRNHGELVERLVRLSQYGDENIDYHHAIKRLTDLKNEIGLGNTGKHKKLIKVNQRIKALENEKEKAFSNVKKIYDLQQSINALNMQLQREEEQLRELLWMEQYHSDMALQHLRELQEKLRQSMENKKRLEEQTVAYDKFAMIGTEDIEDIERNYHTFQALKRQVQEQDLKGHHRVKNKKITSIAAMIIFIASVLVLVGQENLWQSMLLAGILLIGSVIFYHYLFRGKSYQRIHIENDCEEIKRLLFNKLSMVGWDCNTTEDLALAIHELKQGYQARLELLRKIEICEKEIGTLRENIKVAENVFGDSSSTSGDNQQNMQLYKNLVRKYFYNETLTANRLHELIEKKRNRILEIEKSVSRDKKELDILSNSYVHPGDIEEQLKDAMEEKQYYETLREAADIAEGFLKQALTEVQENYSPALNKQLNSILGEITSNKYHEVETGTNLEVIIHDLNAGALRAEQLSRGTVEQIYFSLRVALAQMLSKQEMLPMFIDEAFAQYDDERLDNTLRFLLKLSEKRQIIIFTCQKREIDILRSIHAKFHLILL